MKKYRLLFIAIAVLLLFVMVLGYSKFRYNNFLFRDITPANTEIVQKDVITSVKDALSKKMTLVCEFGDETGTLTKSYIKNGAVRISTSGQTGEFILIDNKMYMWDTNTKQGYIYDVLLGDNQTNQSDVYLSMIDKYKDSCKVESVNDSYFVPPLDVTFQEIPQTPQT